MKPILIFRELFRVYKIHKFLLMVLVLLAIATFATPLYEKASPQANIKTPQDALWWGLVTIAAVGYGDYYPVTLGGKLVGVVLMFTGITLISTIITLIASYYAHRRTKREWDKLYKETELIQERVRRIEHKIDYLVKEKVE